MFSKEEQQHSRLTSQAIWSFKRDCPLEDVSTDSAALQAQSGGKLVGAWRKQGLLHTILCKTERVGLKRLMFPGFVDAAVLFTYSNLGLCCPSAVKQSGLWYLWTRIS